MAKRQGTVLCLDGNLTFFVREVLPSLTNTDSAGNINRTQDLLTNLEHRVTYDSTGRLISKEVLNLSSSGDRWHRSLEYDYDLNNNASRFAYADHNGSNVTEYEYGEDNLLTKTTLNNEKVVTYNYDTFGRLTGKSLNTSTPLNYSYTYEASDWGSGFTTTKIECETIGDTTYKYTYDSYGNITDIIRVNADNTKTLLCTYYYDTYNQLTTVTDYENLDQCSYAYNLAGNITKRIKYKLGTSHNIVSRLEDISYSYGDSEWKDLLTSYGGQTITYDAIGNPLTYRDGITMTWQNGRELATYSDDNYDITYTYDANGMRTGKTVTFGTSTYNYSYVYEGGMLLQMTRNNYVYDFSYDANGTPIGFKYTNPSGVATQYYYGTNSRGDIVAVYHATGSKLATYSYDAYGKPLATTFNSSSPSATIQNAINNNPLRYRSYVYDSETGFYYLQTRYYDPVTCRFINADNRISDVGNEILGYNTFTYCMNNPVNMSDPTGGWPKWLKNAVKWVATNVVKPVVKTIKKSLKSSGSKTYSIGLNGSAAMGVGVSASEGFVTDTNGNVGHIVTYAGGGGTPNASACIYSSMTNAPDIYKLAGQSTQVGGSFDVCGVNIGAEVSTFEDPNTKQQYWGGTALVGIGTPLPFEVHGDYATSYVHGFNVFDIMDKAYIMLMEW